MTNIESTRDQCRHAHRMEIVGRLARDLSHEINNALTVILSYTELLAQDAHGRELRDLAEIRHAAQGAVELTRQLASLTGPSSQRIQLTSVTDALERARRASVSAMPSGVHVHLVAEPTLPPLLIEPVRLDQILVDLLFHARDTLPARGTIRIAARVVTRETAAQTLSPFLEFDVSAQSDLGTIVSRSPRDDALSVARELVGDTGGEMLIESNVCGGAGVKVWLPLPTFETPEDTR